jgi:hypothetical protein
MKLRTAIVGVAAAGLLALTAGTAHAAHARGDLTVGLNGANEVGTTGDKNGSGKIHLDFFAAATAATIPEELRDTPYICYDLTVRNVQPLAEQIGMHIHEGDRKENGLIQVSLAGDAAEIVEENGRPCVAVDPEVFDDILEDPSDYYVNYHTDDHPSGAIRGQLHAFS